CPFLRYFSTSACVGVSVISFLFSNCHCCLAESMYRRLLMHPFICAVVRALTKLGIAMAASKPRINSAIGIPTAATTNTMTQVGMPDFLGAFGTGGGLPFIKILRFWVAPKYCSPASRDSTRKVRFKVPVTARDVFQAKRAILRSERPSHYLRTNTFRANL